MNKQSLALALGLAATAAGCEAKQKRQVVDVNELKNEVTQIVKGVQHDVAQGNCVVDFNKWNRINREEQIIECSDREDVNYGGYEHPHYVSCPTGQFSVFDHQPENPPPAQINENYETDVSTFWFTANLCGEKVTYGDPKQEAKARLYFREAPGVVGMERGARSFHCMKKEDGEGVICRASIGDDDVVSSIPEAELDEMIGDVASIRDSLMPVLRSHRTVHECGDEPRWGLNKCFGYDEQYTDAPRMD